MKETGKLAARIMGAIALFLLFVPSTFADWRHQGETQYVAQRDHRVVAEGRITRIERRYGGFVIELNRGDYTFYVSNIDVQRAPRRMRVDDLRVGALVRIGGYPGRRGYIDADFVEWRGGGDNYRDHDRQFLRGTVHQINDRYATIQIREEDSGRIISVDMRQVERHRRGFDLDDLRRGDRITVSGSWLRNNWFTAERIESFRTR